MIDEMTNPALVAYVCADENSTEMEFELADRLDCAMTEVDILIAERAKLLCQLQARLENVCGDA